MRSAEQIGRTPREWKNRQEAERERLVGEVLRDVAAARARGEAWVAWIDAGCPTLTEQEYRAQGGGDGRQGRRGRQRTSP